MPPTTAAIAREKITQFFGGPMDVGIVRNMGKQLLINTTADDPDAALRIETADHLLRWSEEACGD